jgi:hypothetical protein
VNESFKINTLNIRVVVSKTNVIMWNKSLKGSNCLFVWMILLILSGCHTKPTSQQENISINDEETVKIENAREAQDKVKDSIRTKLFFKDYKGTWVCYKYCKDTVQYKYDGFRYDEVAAKEFARYYSFAITDDTIVVNGIFKEPVDLESYTYAKLSNMEYYYQHYTMFLSDLNLLEIDSLKEDIMGLASSHNFMNYQKYCDQQMAKGDTIPYFDSSADAVSTDKWCFSGIVAINYKGYNYYFKRGVPKMKGIVGLPSDMYNRFSVVRVYKNSTIKEAVYKMIEEFPKGTEELLFTPMSDGGDDTVYEPYLPMESGLPYPSSTEYFWEGKDKLTTRTFKDYNSTFVFEFVKKGSDVKVKYWNDVTFPFEEGYDDHAIWKRS